MPEPGQILRFEPDGPSSWQYPPRKPEHPYVMAKVRLTRAAHRSFQGQARAVRVPLADWLGSLLDEHIPED